MAGSDGTFGKGVREDTGSRVGVGASLGVAVGSAVSVKVGPVLVVGDGASIAAAVGADGAEGLGVGMGAGVVVGRLCGSTVDRAATADGISGGGGGVEQAIRRAKMDKDRNKRTKETTL